MATVADAVSGGDRRESLEALRDHLAAGLEEATGRDVASIARELRAVLAELDSLPVDREESHVDQLAEARANRRQNAAG